MFTAWTSKTASQSIPNKKKDLFYYLNNRLIILDVAISSVTLSMSKVLTFKKMYNELNTNLLI